MRVALKTSGTSCAARPDQASARQEPVSAPFVRAALAFAVLAIALGVVVRFDGVERKLFWSDEAYTALLVSGHTEASLLARFDGARRPAHDVAALQDVAPGSNVVTVMRALAIGDPQHATLFYAIDRAAIDVLGTGVFGYRLPSVLFGIAAIVLAFWLGREVGASLLGGAVLAALVAVSPLHVLYAHQAREYAMMTAAMLVATAALLRALRAPSAGNWTLYAVTAALGLYTDPLVALAVLAHAFTAWCWPDRSRRAMAGFALAAASATLAFVPWVIHAVLARGRIAGETSWGASVYPLHLVAQKWIFNLGAIFFDAEFATLRLAPVAAAALVVAAIAVALTARRGGRAAAVALPLIAVTFGVFILRDVVTHAHFSTIPRYLFAGWIGIQIATAAVITTGIRNGRAAALAAFAFLLAAGSYSVVLDDRYENWWDNNDQIALQAVARRIDAGPHALVLSEGPYAALALVLARYLRPDDELVLFPAGHVPDVVSDRPTFILAPTAPTLAALARDHTVENVSPAAANAITTFHAALKAAQAARSDVDVYTAGNALWSIGPRAFSSSPARR